MSAQATITMPSHYSVISAIGKDGMKVLLDSFPNGIADEYNQVLFSTSGVHGTYSTIEDAEFDISHPNKIPHGRDVTFLIIRPRVVAMIYGTCRPRNIAEINWLKELRRSSHKILKTIGMP